MRLLIAEHSLFTLEIESNRGVVNLFTNVRALQWSKHTICSMLVKLENKGYINYVTHHCHAIAKCKYSYQEKATANYGTAQGNKKEDITKTEGAA